MVNRDGFEVINEENAHPKERKLLIAVLARAIGDFLKISQIGGRVEFRYQRSARAWFASTDDKTEFTFEWVCLHLDRDPNVLRNRLNRLDKATFKEKMSFLLGVIQETPSRYAKNRYE